MGNPETHIPGPIETGIDLFINFAYGILVGKYEKDTRQHQPIKGVLITGDGTQLPISPDLSQKSHRAAR